MVKKNNSSYLIVASWNNQIYWQIYIFFIEQTLDPQVKSQLEVKWYLQNCQLQHGLAVQSTSAAGFQLWKQLSPGLKRLIRGKPWDLADNGVCSSGSTDLDGNHGMLTRQVLHLIVICHQTSQPEARVMIEHVDSKKCWSNELITFIPIHMAITWGP